MSTYKFRFPVCKYNFYKFVMDTLREIHTALKNHYAIMSQVTSMIFAHYSKRNFSRKKQND